MIIFGFRAKKKKRTVDLPRMRQRRKRRRRKMRERRTNRRRRKAKQEGWEGGRKKERILAYWHQKDIIIAMLWLCEIQERQNTQY